MRRRIALGSISLAAVSLGFSAPAHALTCTPGPYIIFFDPGSAQVGREGLEILDNAVRQAGDCGSGRTMIAGFTDTREDPRLAQDRLEVVRAYFLAHGFPRRSVTIRSFGATHQRIATARNVSERQNRRIEITYGPAEPLRH